jgi:hypothetical protein
MLAVYIRNISNLRKISDYEFLVMLNAQCIDRGIVKGHKRTDGYKELLRKIADATPPIEDETA